MIKIKKTSPASQSYGNSQDQRYQPAFYDVLKDGKTVGFILSPSVTYMEQPNWQVLEIVDGVAREIKIFWGSKGKPFTKAKQWAMEHFA